MATTIKLKNSVTTTNAPSSLVQGEVAINITDKKVWVGNAATTPVQLLGTGADGSFTNLAYSGTLTGGTGVVNLGSGQFYKDASGNVGIGTTGGVYKLDVVGAGAQSIRVASSNGDLATLRMLSSGNNEWSIASDTVMRFRKDSTEYMRIDSSGNVGIGTSSPQAPLNVSHSVTSRSDTLRLTNADTGGYGPWLNFYGNYSSGYSFAKIGTENDNGTGGSLRFHTADTSKVSQERMRIDSSGNLLVGTTSGYSTSTKLYVSGTSATNWISGINDTRGDGAGSAGALGFFRNGTNVGGVQTSTTATSYVTSSDYRLKENIAPMTGALATVAQLKPVTYNWKADGSVGQGFIAHELAEVVPDCVTGEKDAVDKDGNPVYQGIDTSFLVATLTAAIQEQQAIINDLKARIETLESK